jgi:hypothetical protein
MISTWKQDLVKEAGELFERGITDSLAHLQQKCARPVTRGVHFAGVIGLGYGIGLRKMARIPGTINEDALEHAANWHFSRENLISANDGVMRRAVEDRDIGRGVRCLLVRRGIAIVTTASKPIEPSTPTIRRRSSA